MNNEQLAAANSNAANVLVLAGPGSGKTTTLVEAVYKRCRESGPQSVICVTFTVAGAREMKERLAKRYRQDQSTETTTSQLQLGFCGTLHAFLLRLLRKHHKLVGLPKDIAVVDEDAIEGLLDQVMADMGSRASLDSMLKLVAMSRLILGEKRPADSREELVVLELHRRLKRNGLLTLDALLAYGFKLIDEIRKERQAVGEADWWPYEHLFVDEYQDSATLDARIYDAMPCWTKFKVGDPDQAIYGFRGGNIANIINEAKSGGSEIHRLEINYRCRKRVADLAQKLVDNNRNRDAKKTIAAHTGGEVQYELADTPIEEMNNVASWVEWLLKEKQVRQDEIAVLCRTRREVAAFVPFIKSQGLPVASGERPPLPRDWRAAKLVVSALANPASDMVWLALVEALDGIDLAARVKVNASMKMTSVSAAAAAASSKYTRLELPAMSSFLSPESRQRLHDACRELSANGEWSLADLSAYLQSNEQRVEKNPGVFVGTVHSAKGREWDAVFMVGLEEGNFPQLRRDSDLEEERRLAFVGMTRARHWLFLSSCRARPQNRGPNQPPGPLEPRQPSRFIKEAGL